jgi:phosphoribosylformylglycinamidine cyclo-ligase
VRFRRSPYKKAGLDLAKYEQTIAGIQPLLARTHDRRVIPPPFPPRKGGKGVGGFASLFDLNPDGRYRNPVLVTCTDGVGSKLKVASLMGKFDTVGIDLVAMSVNDLICTGGEPLVFLDYLAMPKDDPELTSSCCRASATAASRPGARWSAARRRSCRTSTSRATSTWPGSRPAWWSATASSTAGRSRPATRSSGWRRAASTPTATAWCGRSCSRRRAEGNRPRPRTRRHGRRGVADADAAVREAGAGDAGPDRSDAIHGLANITGGGLPDNVARILPPGKRVVVRRGAWPVPPVFGWLQRLGNVADAEMFRVFNMGVGFVVICAGLADRRGPRRRSGNGDRLAATRRGAEERTGRFRQDAPHAVVGGQR